MVQMVRRYYFLLGYICDHGQRDRVVHIYVYEKSEIAFQPAGGELGVFRFLFDVLHVSADGLVLLVRDVAVRYYIVFFFFFPVCKYGYFF